MTPAPVKSSWRQRCDARQLRLIRNCQEYAAGDPAGLPGHQLLLIVARLVELLDARATTEVQDGTD